MLQFSREEPYYTFRCIVWYRPPQTISFSEAGGDLYIWMPIRIMGKETDNTTSTSKGKGGRYHKVNCLVWSFIFLIYEWTWWKPDDCVCLIIKWIWLTDQINWIKWPILTGFWVLLGQPHVSLIYAPHGSWRSVVREYRDPSRHYESDHGVVYPEGLKKLWLYCSWKKKKHLWILWIIKL